MVEVFLTVAAGIRVLSKNTIDPKPRLFGWVWALGSGHHQATDDHDSDSLVVMPQPSYLLRFMLVALAGWINQEQRNVIDYLQEENRTLREQLGPGRLRFTDAQRLAAKAKILGRVLRDIANDCHAG
jgi:hypothetical protein